MANEVVQWALLLGVSLLVLGLLRQISLTSPPAARGVDWSGPPIGRPLPRDLLARIQTLTGGSLTHGATVGFVSEACSGCQRLLSSIAAAPKDASARPLILTARNPSLEFQSALEEAAIPVIYDDGALWEACRITATPLLVRIDEEGRVVGKELTHRVDEPASIGTKA
jgi:hypothetical protein